MLKAQEAFESLNEYLRLDTYPLGIRFMDENAFPPEVKKVSDWGFKVAICQVISVARKWNMVLGLRAEDISCASALLAFGWGKLPLDRDRERVVMDFLQEMKYMQDEKAAKETLRYLPWVRDGWTNEKSGMVIGPLGKWSAGEPEVVLIYGNTAQIARLVQSTVYIKGGVVRSEAHVGLSCAVEILNPKMNGKPGYVLPGRGERQLGMAGNDELVFVLPWNDMPDLIAGLKATQESGSRYPVNQYLFFRPLYPQPIEKLRGELQLSSSDADTKEKGSIDIDTNIVERAQQLFKEGYYCSQVTAILLQERLGLDSDETIKALSAFSGGVGRDGSSCGVLSASMAILGLVLGKGKTASENPRLSKYMKVAYDRFTQEVAKDYSSANCRDIAGVDWWNPASAREFLTDPKRLARCQQLIASAVTMVSEVLKEARAN